MSIKCDASRAGLGAALEQRMPTGWHTVAFASRFPNSNEERYSVNELELLGVCGPLNILNISYMANLSPSSLIIELYFQL